MYSDGTRFVQTLRDDHVAERAIESGHLNHIKALISPVDVSYTNNNNIEIDVIWL